MSRRILLTLAEDTSPTHCGKCDHFDWADGGWCGPFGPMHGDTLRHDACLSAERAASRLLDVSPEDAFAAFGVVRGETHKCGATEHEANAAYGRIIVAMNEHAAKAEVKP